MDHISGAKARIGLPVAPSSKTTRKDVNPLPAMVIGETGRLKINNPAERNGMSPFHFENGGKSVSTKADKAVVINRGKGTDS